MLIHLLATWIPALLIGLSGVLKVSGNPKILETMTAFGVGRHVRLLGVMELASANRSDDLSPAETQQLFTFLNSLQAEVA